MLSLRKMDFKERCNVIKWAKAKTTAKVGPYTTHSQYSTHTEFIRSFIDKASHRGTLLKRDHLKAVRTALREANNSYDLRSIRRGALQALAKTDKLTMAQLRVFSGHTTDKSLLRYLDFGAKLPRTENISAAAALWQPAATQLTQ